MKNAIYLSINDKSKYSSQMRHSFGEYIRTLRTSNDYTLTQLGAKLNIDSANLSKIENGKRDFDEKKLILLAKVFGLDIKKLQTEYYSELFAKKIYQTDCSDDILRVVGEKVKHYRAKNVKLKL